MKHTTITVFAFQHAIIPYLKAEIVTLNHIHYFSDGAASQYKNYKNFANLRHHKQDFGLNAEWNFFATSHGKNPCDGIGGTVKRLAARASLQRPLEGQILTSQQFFKFCEDNIKGIKFFFVKNETVSEFKKSQEHRFKNAKTIPGTRDNHSFVPSSLTELKVSRVSGEIDNFIGSGTVGQETVQEYFPGQYIACLYDGNWWCGNIVQRSTEYEDYEVKFMHPHGPCKQFKWPLKKDDICWVPAEHILQVIPPPTASSSRSARSYTIDQSTVDSIKEKFLAVKKSK